MRRSTAGTSRHTTSGSSARTSSSRTSASSRAPVAHASTSRRSGGGGGGGPVPTRYPLNCWHCKTNVDVSTYVCPGYDCGVRPFMQCNYPGCGPNGPRHIPC